jgi:hypothetical protein
MRRGGAGDLTPRAGATVRGLDAVAGAWVGVGGGAAAKVAATIVPMREAEMSTSGPPAQLTRARDKLQQSTAKRTDEGLCELKARLT